MPYLVHDKDALVLMGAGDDEMECLQAALTQMESNGLTLHTVVQQHHTWDDDGMPSGQVGPYFVFHRLES